LNWASKTARGEAYGGRSSRFWYDAAAFHELLLAAGAQPVRSLVARLDGIRLLEVARQEARPVNPERLGRIGKDLFSCSYASRNGTALMGSTEPQAEIPYVVEAWAMKTPDDPDFDLQVLINRTPITAAVSIWRADDKDLVLQGCGIDTYSSEAPKKSGYAIVLNLITPYCPITSDGKAPDLQPFSTAILDAIVEAIRKAQRAAPRDKKFSQKDVVLAHLEDVIADVSDNGEYRFNPRQLFYQLRPIVLQETGQELKIGNFSAIITDYESERGEIPGMYREPRGSIYHPHRDETITLGTLTVEGYNRPVLAVQQARLYREGGVLRSAEGGRLAQAARLLPDVVEGLHHPRRSRPRGQARRA
jgi:hypothetical protein